MILVLGRIIKNSFFFLHSAQKTLMHSRGNLMPAHVLEVVSLVFSGQRQQPVIPGLLSVITNANSEPDT